MICSDVKDLLNPFVDESESLPDDQASQIEEHLESCEECREEEVRIRLLLVELADLRIGTTPTEPEVLTASALRNVRQARGEAAISNLVEFADSRLDVHLRGREMLAKSALAEARQSRLAAPDSTRGRISHRFIRALSEALASRDFKNAKELFGCIEDVLMELDPEEENAAALVELFARWIDLGYDNGGGEEYPYREILRRCLEQFPRAPRPRMKLKDVAYLRMAAGFLALATERLTDAVREFHFVCEILPELGDADIGYTAKFAIAKAYRRMGEYDEAYPYADEAIKMAAECGRAAMAGAFSITMAWIMFQRFQSEEASALLKSAEMVLQQTDDHLRLGNIRSALGRIAYRGGRYFDAHRYYEAALTQYDKWDGRHRHAGRVRINMAFVLRHIANDLEREGDPRVEESGKIPELRAKAETHLREAEKIYVSQGLARGVGKAKRALALLRLDCGHPDEAETLADEAYALAVQKRDSILQVRAQVVQCLVQTCLAEQEANDLLKRASRLQWAETCAREAVAIAEKKTRRLLGRASMCLAGVLLAQKGKARDALKWFQRCGKEWRWPRQGPHWEELEELKRGFGSAGIPLPEIETLERMEVLDEVSMLGVCNTDSNRE